MSERNRHTRWCYSYKLNSSYSSNYSTSLLSRAEVKENMKSVWINLSKKLSITYM